MKTPMVIALDLEGTLISDAFSVFPRPGLFDFLEFCRKAFSRILVFTSVPEERTLAILSLLAEKGSAPVWSPEDISYVQWFGAFKDLRFIQGCLPGQALIIDDQETVIMPEQKQWWVPIREYKYPYRKEDRELARVAEEIASRLEF